MDDINNLDYRVLALQEAKCFGNKCLESINISNFQNNRGFFEIPNREMHEAVLGSYDLSGNLLLQLQLYDVTLEENFLKNVNDITRLYFLRVLEKETLFIHLGMSSVCSKLYEITGDEKFLYNALSIIKFEESLTISKYYPEQIIITNLLALLQLFSLSGNDDLLFKINLSILKLLGYACFEQKGVYWAFLYRLPIELRKVWERKVKLVFFELFKCFNNDPFLFIAHNIAIKANQKKHGEPHFPSEINIVGENEKGITELENITLQVIIELNNSFLAERSIFDRQIIKTLRKVNSFNKVTQNVIPSGFYAPLDFISSIVYYYAFMLTNEDQYLSLCYKKVDQIIKHGNWATKYSSDFYHTYARMTFFNQDFFKLFFLREADVKSFLGKGKKINLINTVRHYPGINLSKPELKQLILSNRFKRSIILLRNKSPRNWHRYLNSPIPPRGSAIIDFLQFVRVLFKSNNKLKDYMAPTFALELTAHRLIEKLQFEKYDFSNDVVSKVKVLELPDDAFYSLTQSVVANIEIVKMKWHPIIRVYTFTIAKRYIRTNEDFVAIRYNPLRWEIDEFIVNEMTALTINLFKETPSIKAVLEKMCRLIGHENMDEVRSLVIGKIKNLIEIDWLLIR